MLITDTKRVQLTLRIVGQSSLRKKLLLANHSFLHGVWETPLPVYNSVPWNVGNLGVQVLTVSVSSGAISWTVDQSGKV